MTTGCFFVMRYTLQKLCNIHTIIIQKHYKRITHTIQKHDTQNRTNILRNPCEILAKSLRNSSQGFRKDFARISQACSLRIPCEILAIFFFRKRISNKDFPTRTWRVAEYIAYTCICVYVYICTHLDSFVFVVLIKKRNFTRPRPP